MNEEVIGMESYWMKALPLANEKMQKSIYDIH